MGKYTKTTANGKQACRELWESILDTKEQVGLLKALVGGALFIIVFALITGGTGAIAAGKVIVGAAAAGAIDVVALISSYAAAQKYYKETKINYMLASDYAS